MVTRQGDASGAWTLPWPRKRNSLYDYRDNTGDDSISMALPTGKAERTAAPGNNARSIQWLVIGAVLLFAWGGFAALLGYDLKVSWDQEFESAQRDADNLSRVLERHLTATVEKIDIVLRNTVREIGSQKGKPDPATVNRELLRQMEAIPEAQHESLRIIGADGRVRYNAGAEAVLPEVVVADRSYFLRQERDPTAGLVISEPIFSRFTMRWVVTLSRRLTNPDGSFAGVAQAAVRAEYIQSMFESLNLGSGGSIALYDTDMRLIARHPVAPDQLGKAYDLTHIKTALAEGRAIGTYNVFSRVDGVQREYSFRKLDTLPFVVLIGLSPEEILDSWWRKAVFYAISLLAMTLELGGLLLLQRKSALDRISYLATHDALTNLPNRLSLEEHLVQNPAGGERGKPPMALLSLDLDHFKNINDSLGHQLGDRLLRKIAERLRAALRDTDTVTRHGGDEFVVLLKGSAGSGKIAEIAQALLDKVIKPIHLDQHELVITASIGIAVYPGDGSDIVTLLKNADAAMFQAKSSGRNTYRFYTAEMNARLAERLNTENSLRKAMSRGELHLYYQPQFETATCRVIGFEALLRWKHPELGMVPPARFIPIAEETGLIGPIGEWVLREACRQNKAWQDAGLPPVVIAVNLSAVQFRQHGLVAMVQSALAETGLDSRWLELEVTESVLMHDIEHVIVILHQLKALGIQLSIDDFGTGYSSLSYLKRFPIDKIKIDQSFVRDVQSSGDDAAIVQTVIAIAGKMGMRAIAEGVETAAHLNTLHSFGCDEVQGFLFSPAVPPAEAEGFFTAPAGLPPDARPPGTRNAAQPCPDGLCLGLPLG